MNLQSKEFTDISIDLLLTLMLLKGFFNKRRGMDIDEIMQIVQKELTMIIDNNIERARSVERYFDELNQNDAFNFRI